MEIIMKKKLIIIAIVITAAISVILITACDNDNAQPAPRVEIEIENFQQIRTSFPAIVLVPERYNGERIVVHNNEAIGERERNEILQIIRWDKIVIDSLVMGYWDLTCSEYNISVVFNKYNNYSEEIFNEGNYERTEINGYKAYRKKIVDEDGQSNSHVYFVDEINKIEYNVNCDTVVNDKRIDTDTIINEYIDSMCLRNGVGFNQ